MTEKSTEPVRAIAKACTLLDLLTEAKRPLSLAELTEAAGWAKSTVYGLLSSMRSCNLVEQDAQSGRYTLGVRLFEYGSAVNATRNIITLSREPMERLVKTTGESASLSMLDRGEALVLLHAEPDSAFHIVSETGAHLPAFCTAQGKVLLSALSDAAVRRIFEALGYRVVKLDRVLFAGLTKKNLKRGDWRFLTEKEVDMLRMGAFE